ncbi:hypothetical protein [Streptococcus dysgalactiae]|uniref:hypothetical protein n=1 Tax=Streptococcus dysgalactiae TaxID=1334 RepID=UPI00194FD428|nr:hypothetical protein [Streptococcus dysgalactiae]MBM6549373.1 hypothetical protein [Streptococcus dysgalactiae subsp. equisimilis]
MGSSLGAILAYIYMAKLENSALTKHIKDCVDNIICISHAKTDINKLLHQFNQAHAPINFTLEMESVVGFAFLDVLLSRRNDGSLRRTIHRKKTWTGQYTHYQSFVPMNQKRNIIRCVTNRALKICSKDSLENEMAKVKAMFWKTVIQKLSSTIACGMVYQRLSAKQ